MKKIWPILAAVVLPGGLILLAVWLWKTNKQLKATSQYAIATGAQLDDLQGF